MKRLVGLFLTLAIVCLLVPAQDRARRGPIAAASGSTLNDFTECWKMEDVNGVNGQNLTNNNVVTFTAGKINNGANFVAAATQSLTHADDATLSIPGSTSYTWAGWIKLTAFSGTQYIVSKADGNPTDEYKIRSESNGLTASHKNGDDAFSQYAFNSPAPTAGNWFAFVMVYDVGAATLTLTVNNDTANQSVKTSYTTIADSDAQLTFGGYGAGAPTLTGSLDAFCLWKRVLTAGEQTEWYNSGTGKEPPF